jgi:hypothetical protein
MHFDARESLEELKVQPRPIDESLADAVSWFREQGWMGQDSGRKKHNDKKSGTKNN